MSLRWRKAWPTKETRCFARTASRWCSRLAWRRWWRRIRILRSLRLPSGDSGCFSDSSTQTPNTTLKRKPESTTCWGFWRRRVLHVFWCVLIGRDQHCGWPARQEAPCTPKNAARRSFKVPGRPTGWRAVLIPTEGFHALRTRGGNGVESLCPFCLSIRTKPGALSTRLPSPPGADHLATVPRDGRMGKHATWNRGQMICERPD